MAVFLQIPEGDLDLVNGDFAFVEGADEIRQSILSRFRFFLGEWFLDRREGVPYYRDVFVKNPDRAVVRSVFAQVLVGTPGVLSVNRFEIQFDAKERTIRFDFEVYVDNGTIVVLPEDDTFIVRV